MSPATRTLHAALEDAYEPSRAAFETPPGLRVLARLDAAGELLIVVETRETDALGAPASVVSVSWNRYGGEAIACATGEIPASPLHVEHARRVHTGIVMALCAATVAGEGVGRGRLEELGARADRKG